MTVKAIVQERFEDYKLPSLYLGCAKCNWKCAKENGFPISVCINSGWGNKDSYVVDDDMVIQRYLKNPITSSVVFGLFEPFEQFDEMFDFIKKLRTEYGCNDDVVIYTGYNETEISSQVELLKQFQNIIIKFGRFRLGDKPHYDEVLGVNLISDNQYAEKIS